MSYSALDELAQQPVMFSSNNTKSGELRKANERGAIINIDDITFVEQFLEECSENLPQQVCLRYNPMQPITDPSGNVMGDPSKSKYGMSEEQILEAVKILKERGIREIGLHSFTASNTLVDSYYPDNAASLFRLARKIYESFKGEITIPFVNFSGGVGIPCIIEDETKQPNIKKIGEKVREYYEKILEPDKTGIKPAIKTELRKIYNRP